MSGKFVVKAITDLNNAEIGLEISESDYSTLTNEGKFVQLQYVEEKKEPDPYKVYPGIFSIVQGVGKLELEKTSFTKDNILEDFVNTKDIEEKADCFFRNVHKYKELGFEIARRNMLLFGPPGTGKSTALAKVCNKYVGKGNTTIVVFPTEKFESYQVKDLIKSFSYEGVERLILIMEDVGGVEMEEVRRGADAGLLSLLDNNEKTFKISTLIIATTNFPEVLMGSLTNRPGRFDDKIRAGYPNKEARVGLAEFFLKRKVLPDEQALLSGKSSETLSPAHIKEVLIRSVIHEKTFAQALKEVIKEAEEYNKGFKEGGKDLGFN